MTTIEYKAKLWEEFVDKSNTIPGKYKESMLRMFTYYSDNMEFLMEVYNAFVEGNSFLEDSSHGVRYGRDDERYILAIGGVDCVFEKDRFKAVLTAMLDLFEDTLPLGSVVDLKKEAYRDNPDIDKIEHVRLVVTYRFLGPEAGRFYFPYAGVVYPTGMLGRKEVLYFTRPLVEKVVQKGYADELEDAYVYLMKQELVIEKGKRTIGYAEKTEIDDYNRKYFKK